MPHFDDKTREELVAMLDYAASLANASDVRITKLQDKLDKAEAEWRAMRAKLKQFAPYPMFCSDPISCAGTGRCPRDPVCNN